MACRCSRNLQGARPRDLYATTPSLGCGVLIASKKQHLAEMPPAIDTAWVLGEVVLKQRHVTRDFVTLIALIADVLQHDIANADLQTIASANLHDSIMHALVDHTPKANAWIVAEKAQFGIGRPANRGSKRNFHPALRLSATMSRQTARSKTSSRSSASM